MSLRRSGPAFVAVIVVLTALFVLLLAGLIYELVRLIAHYISFRQG
jgi:hypothetical protein